MRRNLKRLSMIAVLLGFAAFGLPATASAQRRVVVAGGPFYYGPFYDPWFGSQWGYPYPYPPSAGYRVIGPEASLRLEVEPKNASVFVDGYLAGTVDDFDGVFQRLHVQPGEHEIVVYLEGYKSLKERLYLGPNTSRKITQHLEKLAAGEPDEPRPVPSAGPQEAAAPPSEPPPQAPAPRRRSSPPPRGPESSSVDVQEGRSGTVSIRVQPGDAEILIDGERWAHGSADDDRLIVQLADGTHRIEAQKDGYRPMMMDVRVHRGETVPVNISLSRP